MENERAVGSVVVGANWYRFRRDERIRHDRVMSVCFIWPVEGRGTITSRREEFEIDAGSLLCLPWGHDVAYSPDPRAPFRLGTVHLVPWHTVDAPVVPRVAHIPGDPLFEVPERADSTAAPRVPCRIATTGHAGRRLAELGAYTIERYRAGGFEEQIFRALGMLLMAEIAGLESSRDKDSSPPLAVELMTAFVAENLGHEISVADVAGAGDCSPATAQRLLSRHTGRSVASYIRAARMRAASELLRTSGLRVHEVAREVGFADPLYFSRVFRNAFGTPPSVYARDQIRP